jgi:Protein of unknown function (DUF2924)
MAKTTRTCRQRHAADDPADDMTHAALTRLEPVTAPDLRWEWKLRFGTDAPPTRSSHLLRRLLVWKIQESAFGGLDAETRRTLGGVATALQRDGSYEPQIRRGLSPGVVLTREWKGVIHKVTVTRGGFECSGRLYKSLSDIARTITGTRWSGPRFFGLEQKTRRRSSDAVGTSSAAAVAP